LVPGFPLDFYNRYRVHPFVSPAAHPKLQSVVVPLGGGTASYDLTRRYLEDHELPPPEQIRVEEFIEALDYQYPPPNKRPLALSTALGPSPFGGEGLVMLQVGVQARRPAKTPHPPMHLVLALDLSTSMNWGGRLELVKQAFGHLLEQLTAEDRISLVVFSEEAETLFEEAGADEAPQMAAVVNSLQLRSSTNIGAGLREAYAVAQRAAAETGRQTRVVLLTDGTAPADRDVFALIRNRLVESAARAVRLDVLDLGQGTEPDRQLVAFAHAGSGRHFRATTADQVRWALLESLTGKSQMVAADVRLTVSFNPRAVLAYRLLGHEGSAFTALLGERPEADFHAGQSSTALFELRLTPNNEEEVATVEVCWQPLEGGEPQRLVRKVTRKQLASSFAGSPWSLQGAVLAARTAEILRNPRIPRNTRPLLAVLELARQVDPQWHHRPCFQRFLALVEEAERIKSHRNGKAR
jgi:Ca-activated chloride channel family protein